MIARLDVTPALWSQTSLALTPLASSSAGSEVDFGVDVGELDLEHLGEAPFAALERAVLTHQVVVVRGQERLSPRAQLDLTRRFDPVAKTYGHGHRPDIMKRSVLVQDLVSIPDVPEVKLLGNGRVKDHEGLPEVDLRHPSHRSFHREPLTEAQEARGLTRFYRWHIDAALYELHPPRVTTLLALEVPEPRRETVVYDDGSGDTLEVQVGATAFVSGAKAFDLLSPSQRAWALKTEARYAAHPYVWMRNARALPNGLGLVSEGRELQRDELPPFEVDKVMTLPLVWKNPLTGRRALQVHACCVEDLIVDGQPIGDLAECRRLLYELMRPAIAPSRVYAHPWRPGDLVIFHNRGLWHSVVGSLRPTDLRVYHQCNLAASEAPLIA
ncbi:TauD/TfdA family dioxygenase [Sorangium sp. So ce726]|uniref:TauD/TfdA dioxygenase family protein n=1 Tax=Sorangium sp. So ce726 TaxID=3133319 RepID=UPI003F6070AE